jgi:preprotein translocase subunit SecG
MKEKIKLINQGLLFILLIVSIILIIYILMWLPKVGQSIIRVNNAQCLESYHNQNQPPLGACGYDFS